jgi:hypothetical protein
VEKKKTPDTRGHAVSDATEKESVAALSRGLLGQRPESAQAAKRYARGSNGAARPKADAD